MSVPLYDAELFCRVCRLDERLGGLVEANQYTHPPLSEQLTEYHVRALELDVFDDRQVQHDPASVVR